MKILILGAGGIGGYFGGCLAKSGADVTFLVRPARAAQLARHGLIVKSPFGDLELAVKTVLAGQLTPGYDMIMITLKAYDLDAALTAVAPAVGANSAVLPFLNGVRHLDLIAARFGDKRVLGGVAYIAATLNADGEVVHLNQIHKLAFGELSGERSARCEALASVMAKARFNSVLSDTIRLDLWEKFVFLSTLAGMTCLMRAGVGAIMQARDGETLMLEMFEECRKVAAANGYAPRPQALENTRKMLTERGSGFTASMLRDIERGGPTEGEHIVGDMLRRAEELKIEAPLLRAALCHLQAYEAIRAAG
ncbi:MAG: 2-dehydropantoate 2-reductase [Betaproteobacteria bacterium]|nr:2-dehydropantoate 2-reductase [Betaproteobacteria bacterium]